MAMLAVWLPCAAQAGGPEAIGGRPWTARVRAATPMPRPPTEPADAAIALPEWAQPAQRNDLGEDDGRPGIAGTLVDGHAAWPSEARQPIDGQFDVSNAEEAPETDIASDDSPAADIAVFARPPGGFDPGTFSIEPDPFDDRRPARFARLDPFDAVGVRIGSFILYPEVELGLAAFNNVFHTRTDRRGDLALEARPAVRAVSTWARHALEVRAAGDTSFHNRFSSEDDHGALLEARGRLDITRRTSIEALASWALAQEERGSIDAPASARDRADVETRRVAVSANHRINRLSLQLRGTLTDVTYGPVTTAAGDVVSNDDRDYTERGAALRVGWLLKPGLSVFGEVAANTRDHAAVPDDGIVRDSSGERYRAGLSFGDTDAILRGEVSIGYGRQHFESRELSGIDGILVDANLAWRMSALTSLLLTARSGIAETIVSGSGGAMTHTAGVEVRHAFRRHLIGSAAARYTHWDYSDVALSESEFAVLLGLEYHISREVALLGRYEHSAFDSTDPSRRYDADEVRLGVRVRR